MGQVLHLSSDQTAIGKQETFAKRGGILQVEKMDEGVGQVLHQIKQLGKQRPLLKGQCHENFFKTETGG